MLAAILVFSMVVHAPDSHAAGWGWIKPDRARLLQKEGGGGAWLIDVRGPGIFEDGHIEGAVNIPLELLKVKGFPKGKRLVLIDDSLGQHQAIQGAEALASKGFNVSVLEGGIRGWSAQGYPIAGDISRMGVVTPVELKKAFEINSRADIFDLRPEEEFRKGTVPGAVSIKGRDIAERTLNLKKQIEENEKKYGGLEREEAIVLILPESQHPRQIEQNIPHAKTEVRYLLGGFGAWVALHSGREVKTVGDCPYCGGSYRR